MPAELLIRRTGYPTLTDLSRVAEAFKRCRREQYFVCSAETLDAHRPTCPVCHEPVTAEECKGRRDGARGVYNPRARRAVVMHYPCSWRALLTEIFAAADEGRL